MSQPSLLDIAGFDTWLARTLLAERLVDLPTLQHLLAEARVDDQLTLARLVQRRSLVEDASLEQLLQRVAPATEEASEPSFGGHRLVRRVGAGGMGVVYLAVHEATGAQRAIKTLTPRDPEDVIRFRREAEALARVGRHRNVVAVHDLGTTDRRLYLVMDYAAGGSLEDRLKGGPLPPREAASLVASLARGLAHVHQTGILHRDLKPANVLFDEVGTPKLVDFGLAKLRWEGSLTASGAVMGTPAYMAPEQVLDSASCDERSDIYGLGAVLYACLTGEPPFRGRTALSTLTLVLEGKLPPPSARNPAVEPWLDALCLQALSRAPSHRPPTAEAFAEALEGQRAPSRPVPVALLAGAAGALILLLVALLSSGEEPRRPPTPPAPSPTAAKPTPAPAPAGPAWPVNWRLGVQAFGKEERALYTDGMTVRTDPQERYQALEALLPTGHPQALKNLAELILTGDDVTPHRFRAAVRYLKRAVKHGEPRAAAHLAALYLKDPRDLSKDPRLLLEFFLGPALAQQFPKNNRMAAALAHLGTGRPELRTASFCEAVLASLRAKREWVPSGPKADAEAWKVVREGLEPPSSRWPHELSNWPYPIQAQFSDEDEALYDRIKKEDLAIAIKPLVHLCRRDHPEAMRHLALQLLTSQTMEQNAGDIVNYLWRAVRRGHGQAAGDLLLLYLPPNLLSASDRPFSLDPYVRCREALGLEPNLRVAQAALTLLDATTEKSDLDAYLERLRRAMPPEAPTFEQAWRTLEEHWEPPAQVAEHRQALAIIDAWLAEQRKRDPKLDAFLNERARPGATSVYETGLKQTLTAYRIGCWRVGMRWSTRSWIGLVDELIATPEIAVAPRTLRRWLLNLAERGEWRAARTLAQLSAPDAKLRLLPDDPDARAAWVDITAAIGKGHGLAYSAAALDPNRETLSLPEAWRVARARWPD